MKTFTIETNEYKNSSLNITNGFNGGIGMSYHFSNGYSASVVCHSFSYGGNDGLYELAVMVNGSIVYDTPITNDVLGWLTMDDVIDVLKDIKELPTR